MKKILMILSAVLVCVLFTINAQAQNTPWGASGPAAGNVGIGTLAPAFQLVVTTGAPSGVSNSIMNEKFGGAGGAEYIMSDLGNTTPANACQWKFKSAAAGVFKIRDQMNASDVFVIEKAIPAAPPALYIRNNGNIGIGTNLASAKLDVNGELKVNGKIHCTEIEVKLSSPAWWPDFVFKSDYQLMPLNEVENFVSKNNHLPGVPSAAEIAKNGSNLGQMDATLLQKVEELTLYMIQLQKDNDALKARISNLEK